jgi:hypothetical protein
MKNLPATFKLKRNFLSQIDDFLVDFDRCNPKKSASQQQEIAQYQALTTKRDSKTNPSS